MKRIFASVLLVLAFLMTACTSSATGMEFLSTLAWSEQRSTTATIEECEYKFTRYAGEKTGTVLTTEDSFLKYTLKEGKSIRLNSDNIPEEIDSGSFTLLISEFSVTYKDIELAPVLLRGQTETIQAVTVFDRYDMSAKFTYKKANVKEAAGDNLAYTMWVDYTGSFLNKRQAKIIYSDGTSTTTNIKAGTYYDAEAFYYVARTLSSLKLSGTQAFKLSLPYEDLLNGNKTLKARSVRQATAASAKDILVDQSVYGLFYDTPVEAENAKIPCFETKLGLDEAKTGPALNMYYSTVPARISFANTISFAAKNVLVAFDYPTYVKTASGIVLGYTQSYILTNYFNSSSGL